MSFNFVNFLTKYAHRIRSICSINPRYKSYFDSLRKFGARDLDIYFLNALLKKKEIQPYKPGEIDFYRNEKEKIDIQDESLWTDNNFDYTGEKEILLNPRHKNQHIDLHSQRIILMEELLKKHYHVKKMSEIREDDSFKLAFVSPATETCHRLWNDNCHINTFLSDDMNDVLRAVIFLNQLIALTPENRMDLVFTNLCTCKQGDEMCEHIQRFEPTGVVFPHSIYYVSDALINNILDSGADVLFTAHIFDSGVEQEIISEDRKIVSWSCYMNNVRFNVLDDKKYIHKSFLPILMQEKNITTKNSMTKLEFWFQYDNMLHASGYITSDPFRSADFASGSVIHDKNNYILGTRHCLRAVNDRDVGSVYVKEDKDEKFMVKVLSNTVQCFNFRAEHFSLYNAFFGKTTKNFKDDDYTNLSSKFAILYPECCVEIANEVYNHLFTVAFNLEPDKLNHAVLKKLFAQTEVLIGSNSNNHYMNYVVLKNILYDVLLANIMVDDLARSKIVKLLNKFPIQENLVDKIANFFMGETTMDKDLQVIEKQKQTYNEARTIPKENLVSKQVKEVKKDLNEIKNEIEDKYNEVLQIFNQKWYEPEQKKEKDILTTLNYQIEEYEKQKQEEEKNKKEIRDSGINKDTVLKNKVEVEDKIDGNEKKDENKVNGESNVNNNIIKQEVSGKEKNDNLARKNNLINGILEQQKGNQQDEQDAQSMFEFDVRTLIFGPNNRINRKKSNFSVIMDKFTKNSKNLEFMKKIESKESKDDEIMDPMEFITKKPPDKRKVVKKKLEIKATTTKKRITDNS